MATSDDAETMSGSGCTPKELNEIVKDQSDLILLPSRAFDEVYQNIYVSEKSFALNKNLLKQVGITHVLNTAQGISYGHVNTNEEYYKDTGITFYAIKAKDIQGFNIAPFLNSTADMIEGALQCNGKILVHCVEGFSRSPTIVVAFLMIKRNMDVREALKLVRAKREVCPNDGFMKQLCELNCKLLEDKAS